MLFGSTLNGKESWAAVFQSIEAFTPLAKAIFQKEGLDFVPLAHLTPGTNAVFQSGERVIKIYAPPESGFDGQKEFSAEKAAMAHAERSGIGKSRFSNAKTPSRYVGRSLMNNSSPKHLPVVVMPCLGQRAQGCRLPPSNTLMGNSLHFGTISVWSWEKHCDDEKPPENPGTGPGRSAISK